MKTPLANPDELTIYHGWRDNRGQARVSVERPGRRPELFNPPADYEWGYGGAGPARLAWALLYDHNGGAAALASEHQYNFKEEVVRRLPREGWSCTSRHLAHWLAKQETVSEKSGRLAA